MSHTTIDTEQREERGTRIGYTRMSIVSQTLDQQNAALTAAGVTRTFSDVMSGSRDDRPGLAELMAYVREGDAVVVWKLDRLGRNTLHILETVKALTERGVRLVSTTDGIDSATAAGRMVIADLFDDDLDVVADRLDTAIRSSADSLRTESGR